MADPATAAPGTAGPGKAGPGKEYRRTADRDPVVAVVVVGSRSWRQSLGRLIGLRRTALWTARQLWFARANASASARSLRRLRMCSAMYTTTTTASTASGAQVNVLPTVLSDLENA